MSDLISLVEWARKHGHNPATARRKAEKGLIPATKIGRNWLIDENTPWEDLRRKKPE